MSKIIKFDEFIKLDENVAEPTTKPVVKPATPKTKPKPSPLRRTKPSVEPGPKAVTENDLADKFLDLTKDDKSIKNLLVKKYNK